MQRLLLGTIHHVLLADVRFSRVPKHIQVRLLLQPPHPWPLRRPPLQRHTRKRGGPVLHDLPPRSLYPVRVLSVVRHPLPAVRLLVHTIR